MKSKLVLAILTATLFSSFLISQTIWTGPDLTFNKAANADWTLPENQDIITSDVSITRQNRIIIYNYTYWQNTFSTDATNGDICRNYFGVECSATSSQTFTETGGPKGLKWAILDDTGSTTDWSGFSFYGTLGDPTHFYSFHNIITMITELENGNIVTSVDNDFEINGDGTNTSTPPNLVGKSLGVWIESEDIYFTLSFTSWGSGNSGGAVSYTRSTNQNLANDDYELLSSIKVFPNPTQDYINLTELSTVQSFSIYDVSGKEISNGYTPVDNKIDVRNFEKGIYFLKLSEHSYFKFIKN